MPLVDLDLILMKLVLKVQAGAGLQVSTMTQEATLREMMGLEDHLVLVKNKVLTDLHQEEVKTFKAGAQDSQQDKALIMVDQEKMEASTTKDILQEVTNITQWVNILPTEDPQDLQVLEVQEAHQDGTILEDLLQEASIQWVALRQDLTTHTEALHPNSEAALQEEDQCPLLHTEEPQEVHHPNLLIQEVFQSLIESQDFILTWKRSIKGQNSANSYMRRKWARARIQKEVNQTTAMKIKKKQTNAVSQVSLINFLYIKL